MDTAEAVFGWTVQRCCVTLPVVIVVGYMKILGCQQRFSPDVPAKIHIIPNALVSSSPSPSSSLRKFDVLKSPYFLPKQPFHDNQLRDGFAKRYYQQQH